uniref:Uncharacterized protein n=1 Tax=Tanacetum cinerariifolium TaxID=118510 RepID=A0A6L2LG94_TANCI|nr:hypothetical protein [Tanacetum cinerariifolium]
MKVIKEVSKKLELLKINDDSFAYSTPLGTILDEFQPIEWMDDDLFTYDVEIPRLSSIPFNEKEGDDSNDDGKLKEEALNQKSINERSWGDATHGIIIFCSWLKKHFGDFHELDYLINLKNTGGRRNDDEREPNDDHGFGNFDKDLVQDNTHYHEEEEQNMCELLENPYQEPPVCKVRRFEMIKYSFGPGEEYVVKELKYDDLTRANEDLGSSLSFLVLEPLQYA